MDLSPSESRTPNRRSFPNLTHLSLAPLSSRFPIDDDGYDDTEAQEVLKSSYLQGKSAPTTPGYTGRRKAETQVQKVQICLRLIFTASRFQPGGSHHESEKLECFKQHVATSCRLTRPTIPPSQSSLNSASHTY